MEISLSSMDLIELLTINGNPNSVSDAGVAALCARSAVLGGYFNVLINIQDFHNEKEKNKILKKAEKIKKEAISKEENIIKNTLRIIQSK